LIDVRPLFAIHLDADKMAVQKVCCLNIRKSLRRHHMTPMAGGIADGNKKRFFPVNCVLNYFRTPFLPPDRIRCMLEKIRR
jgi:hypothetical protein